MPPFTCLCGRVVLAIGHRPDFIHACNCTLCRKSGARWGYFQPADVAVTGDTATFRRQDKAEPGVDVHFCGTCGATTHFTLTETAVARHGNTMLGVNMQLQDDTHLAGVEVRFPDGRSWPGEGPFGYGRAAEIIGGHGPDAA